MAEGKVVCTFQPAEYRLVRNELEIWQRKMESHAKSLKAGKEKSDLSKRVAALKAILNSI